MSNPKTAGTLYGLVGMVSFSLTLPATRAAVLDLHPAVVAFGRPVFAAALAATVLAVSRPSPPARQYWGSFALMVCGLIFGVPLLFAWGMYRLPASHGAVTLALLPLATALFAVLRVGERPSRPFWIATAVGSAAVLAFAMSKAAGRLQWGDAILFLSVVASAVGYAEGARLSRVYPGWQVISWALVVGAPFLVAPLVFAVKQHGMSASPLAWAGFAYVCLVSQFTGFFAWFKGMASGGVAQIGQLQLLQPFCTLLFSALLLGESVTWQMILAASVVVGAVAIGKRARIARRASLGA